MNAEDDMTAANQTREHLQTEQALQKGKDRTFRGHVLLVEDDSSLARLEKYFLTAHGYIVTQVESGELALNTLHDLIPDLVLLDLELSGSMSGWDVLKNLRAFTGTSTIPVLLTSAEVAAQKHLRTSGEGRSTLDHLAKPYLIQTLLKRIERMLNTTAIKEEHYGTQG